MFAYLVPFLFSAPDAVSLSSYLLADMDTAAMDNRTDMTATGSRK